MEWQYISSKSNQLVIRLAKLKEKKYRKAEGLFKFDGIKLFFEAANSGAPIEYVLVCESASGKYCAEIEAATSCQKLYVLADEVFSKLTDEQSPEGVITICSNLENIENIDDVSELCAKAFGKRVLMLESVRDVGNMGTIIRSAKAFGIDLLVISADCADLYNSKTIRASMGALFTQKIVWVSSIPQAVCAIKQNGSHVYAAALVRDAKKLGEVELKIGDAILIGNEGHGLTEESISSCDECLYIPMEAGSESLNASIAASVCMWELYKIR